MPIQADCHLHSHHSGDSEASLEEMIRQGIRLGLSAMCFTEHNDFDFPDTEEGPGSIFLLNVDSYLYELIRFREKYADRINILFGVELGLQPHLLRQNAVFAKSYDFDFIIASSHLCHGQDPYYPAFFAGREQDACYREYFESILENLQKFQNFDVYGHLDYIVRYGPAKDEGYSYERYRDILDEILKLLIAREKGLELNTGGLKSGLKDVHPCSGILRRYRELGGELVTIGSDAHKPSDIAAHFDRAADVLTACGFRYYATFEKRTPAFHKL